MTTRTPSLPLDRRVTLSFHQQQSSACAAVVRLIPALLLPRLPRLRCRPLHRFAKCSRLRERERPRAGSWSPRPRSTCVCRRLSSAARMAGRLGSSTNSNSSSSSSSNSNSTSTSRISTKSKVRCRRAAVVETVRDGRAITATATAAMSMTTTTTRTMCRWCVSRRLERRRRRTLLCCATMMPITPTKNTVAASWRCVVLTHRRPRSLALLPLPHRHQPLRLH